MVIGFMSYLQDRNQGLVRQCVVAMYKKNIKRLTKVIYSYSSVFYSAVVLTPYLQYCLDNYMNTNIQYDVETDV